MRQPEVYKKLLVIVDIKFLNGESFINNGLIDRVNRMSTFRPAIALDPRSRPLDFSSVRERISRAVGALGRREFDHKPFSAMSFREQLLLTQFLMFLMQKAYFSDIAHAIKEFSSDERFVNINDIVSVLLSMGLILRSSDEPSLIQCAPNVSPLIEFKTLTTDKLRSLFAEMEDREKDDAA